MHNAKIYKEIMFVIHSNYLRVKKRALFEWVLTPREKRDEEMALFEWM